MVPFIDKEAVTGQFLAGLAREAAGDGLDENELVRFIAGGGSELVDHTKFAIILFRHHLAEQGYSADAIDKLVASVSAMRLATELAAWCDGRDEVTNKEIVVTIANAAIRQVSEGGAGPSLRRVQ